MQKVVVVSGRDTRASPTHQIQCDEDALIKAITKSKVELIRAMLAIGPASIRELARRAGRDIKRTHEDVRYLVAVGIVTVNDEKKYQIEGKSVTFKLNLSAKQPDRE